MPHRSAARRSLLDARHRRDLPVAGRDELSTEQTLALLTRVIEAQAAIAASGPDPVDVLAAVTARAQDLTAADGAVLEIRDGDAMVYWSASGMARAQVGLRIPVAGSLSGLCMERGATLHCVDSEQDERVNIEACRRVGLRAMVVVPLRYRDQGVGVLKIVSKTPAAFGAAEATMIEHLATLAGASLHRATEDAMAQAQRQGVRAQYPAPAGAGSSDALSTWLDEVLASSELRIARQPVMRLSDRSIVGWEALARFPERHGVSTDAWFAHAARAGRSEELELAAVRAALAGLEALPGDVYLAINVSPGTACGDALAQALDAVDPRRLVLEITEHTPVEDYAGLAQRLLAYQERGVRIAIDDAGAGFCSLRHVLTLAPDIIKLDLSLVRGVDRRPRVQALVAALCTFAGGTDAALVAEGIETAEELATLQQLGVPYGQGYYLGRPSVVGTG